MPYGPWQQKIVPKAVCDSEVARLESLGCQVETECPLDIDPEKCLIRYRMQV